MGSIFGISDLPVSTITTTVQIGGGMDVPEPQGFKEVPNGVKPQLERVPDNDKFVSKQKIYLGITSYNICVIRIICKMIRLCRLFPVVIFHCAKRAVKCSYKIKGKNNFFKEFKIKLSSAIGGIMKLPV